MYNALLKKNVLLHVFKNSVMIQRIQTLYLFIVAVLTAVMCFFPIASFNYGIVDMQLMVYGVGNQIDTIFFGSAYTWPLIVLTVAMLVLPVWSALIFKKRHTQLKLIQLDMLLTAIFVGLILLYYVSDIAKTISCEKMHYNLGVYFPMANIVFLVLAKRGVRKDIELLRSVDRLR